jgi:threonine aldolase
VAGCMARPVRTPDGILTWPLVKEAIRPKIYYRAQTGLICCENTHNMQGGVVLPQNIGDEICDKAHAAGLRVHLDGARIFNAAAALGVSVQELTRKFDSVMFCVSKGLGAPIGSLLVGSRSFIDEARVYRKLLGGGMRQAGVIAAAGLIALEKSPAKLHVDHDNAKYLAEALSRMPGIRLDAAKVKTNIIVFDVSGTGLTSTEISRKLLLRNVLINGVNDNLMRIVTHQDVDRAGCERAVVELEWVITERTERK